MARRNFSTSFRDAWRGITYCITTQRNLQFHLLAGIAVLVLGGLLHLAAGEWGLVVLVIALVIAAEIFNTAVEKTVDLYVTTYHPVARLAKDMAAGAVLVAAVAAVAIGAIVFLPHLLELLR